MIKDFNLEVPLNSLSFGHVSFCVLRDLWKRGLEPCLFLTANQGDVSAYKVEEDFRKWLDSCAKKAIGSWSRKNPTFRVWHLNGAERNIGDKTVLLTFHETSELTPIETNIARQQTKILVTSDYTKGVFQKAGLDNVSRLNLGYDSLHFYDTKKQYQKDRIVCSLFGKLEPSRKGHKKVIQSWVKRFGNNRDYILHLALTNQFLNEQQHNQVYADIFGGKPAPFNINFLPYTSTLQSYNENLNVTHIVLDMGNEGWSLPSFHTVGLGKYGVIGNWAGLQSWANKDNAILVEPGEQVEAYDGMFFVKGAPFNQGSFTTFNEDKFIEACELAILKFGKNSVNQEGLKLPEQFKWSDTVENILKELENV